MKEANAVSGDCGGVVWLQACDIDPLCQQALAHIRPPWAPEHTGFDIMNRLPEQVRAKITQFVPTNKTPRNGMPLCVAALKASPTEHHHALFSSDLVRQCLLCDGPCHATPLNHVGRRGAVRLFLLWASRTCIDYSSLGSRTGTYLNHLVCSIYAITR